MAERIEFENGSVIQGIDTDEEVIRSPRGQRALIKLYEDYCRMSSYEIAKTMIDVSMLKPYYRIMLKLNCLWIDIIDEIESRIRSKNKLVRITIEPQQKVCCGKNMKLEGNHEYGFYYECAICGRKLGNE